MVEISKFSFSKIILTQRNRFKLGERWEKKGRREEGRKEGEHRMHSGKSWLWNGCETGGQPSLGLVLPVLLNPSTDTGVGPFRVRVYSQSSGGLRRHQVNTFKNYLAFLVWLREFKGKFEHYSRGYMMIPGVLLYFVSHLSGNMVLQWH